MKSTTATPPRTTPTPFIRIDSLPPADALLMLSTRVVLDDAPLARIAALAGSVVDWDRLIHAAHLHGVLPLLARIADALPAGTLPARVADRLRRDVATTAATNLHLTRELIEIFDLFERNGIDLLAYKGPLLSLIAYGDLAQRQFADLDILVRERDLRRADALLIARGYRRLSDELTLQAGAPLPSEGQLVYVAEPGRAVELHWELAQRYHAVPLRFEELWGRRATVPLGGRELPTFSLEDTIIMLAVHGAKHRWERLIWLCDIAALRARHPDAEWEGALARAREKGLGRALLLALLLARDLFGAPLNDALDASIAGDRELPRLAHEVVEGIVKGEGVISAMAERTSFALQTRERPGDRALLILRRLFVPTMEDRRALPMPVVLYPLHWLIRPFRLLLKRMLGRRR